MAKGSDSVDFGQFTQASWMEADIAHGVSTLDIGSDALEPVLCQWHRLELKYFCKVHMEELCATCRRMKHKNCTPLLDIKQATKEIYNADHDEKIMQSIRDLCGQFNDCKTVTGRLKNSLQAKKAMHLDNVKQTRKAIDDFLDKLDANAVADINRNFTEIKTASEEKINVCDASISVLKSNLSDVEETKSLGNQIGRFIKVNTATQQTKQYYNVLQDLCSEVSDIDANLKPTLALSGAFETLKNVFTATSKVTKLFRHATVRPIYTGLLETETRGHGQPNRYHGQSLPQPQPQANLNLAPRPIRAPGIGTQIGQRKTEQQRSHILSDQKPLSVSMLVSVSAQERKQMLGERLFPLIQRICRYPEGPDQAGKVTGMLLELPNEELLDMLESGEKLESKVNEAVTVLAAFQAKEASKEQTKGFRSKKKR